MGYVQFLLTHEETVGSHTFLLILAQNISFCVFFECVQYWAGRVMTFLLTVQVSEGFIFFSLFIFAPSFTITLLIMRYFT